ncbi:DNA mismatch repair protein MutS [Parapedobacter defluvii]|uniref:MutS-related protein n=1 Tax=Parapedobacter defluvii TaxID=2045106 RepID=UPI0033420156
MVTPVFNTYRKNIADTQTQLIRLRRSININSLLRLAAIVGGGAAIFGAVQSEQVSAVMVAFFAVIILFTGLVWRQSRLEIRKTALENFLAVNENEINLSEGEPNRYSNGAVFADSRHPYSGDLDLFGPSSLFAMINRGATPQANALLAEWLLAPTDAGVVKARQQAVGELADDCTWCQEFQARLWFNLHHPIDFKRQFAQFLSNSAISFGNRLLRFYVKAVPWLMVVLIIAAFFVPVFSGIAVFFAIVHLLAAVGCGRKVNQVAGMTDKAGRLLGAFAAAFELIENREWRSQRGKELFSSLRSTTGGSPVSSIFRELAVLIDRLDYRLNMLVGAVLNMMALWDFRQVYALIEWRKKYGTDILHAFDAIAEFEVLGSLAAVSRNHPDWVFPTVQDSTEPFLAAQALAHPLIPADNAVANDYQMRNHRIALITGSNMAGKSTFLRTVGTNAVLAFCGAPVCGHEMHLSVFHLITYMRIADSLNESTSTFKAELNRIQTVLQTVDNQRNTFFLIDEMLRGTNSVDKYRGSKAIIKKLINYGGVGMVATHDLQLAKLAEEHPGVVHNFHFDIQVLDGEMLFDYKLKDGACTVFNASLLLKGIGVEVNEN